MNARDEIERHIRWAADAAVRYATVGDEEPVGPDPAATAALHRFGDVDLDAPIGIEAALEMLDEVGSPATQRSTGGRYFGFVNGGVTAEALAASILSAAWDQNAALPVMSPTAAALDAVAARWLIDILGLPTASIAAFCGGATIANLTAIVAARDHLLRARGWDVDAEGLAGAPPVPVVLGEEAHVSVYKALRIAGFGRTHMTVVPADEVGAIDADRLPPLDTPSLIMAQAGNVNTGHSDPFHALADHCEGGDHWIHVDGAFGLWANAVPARRRYVAGVDRADSWATDGHKWLNAPYDVGVVICRNAEALARAMGSTAAYLPDAERAPMNLGLQMSQAARAVPVWAILAARGRRGIVDQIEHNCQAASRFESALAAAGAEVLAPTVINQTLVAFGDADETQRVIDAVQRDRVAWMGGTIWQGRHAMRISVSDMATTFDDVDAAVESILRCWKG